MPAVAAGVLIYIQIALSFKTMGYLERASLKALSLQAAFSLRRAVLVRYSRVCSAHSFPLVKQEQTSYKLEKQISCMQVVPYYFLYYLPKGKNIKDNS